MSTVGSLSRDDQNLRVQTMADLPLERVATDEPPFSFVGVDLYEPFIVKIESGQATGYDFISTCVVVRVVRIEVAQSLEADSFLNALQRFKCRQDQPVEIRADNGTNFIDGEMELRETIHSWNISKMREFMRQNEIWINLSAWCILQARHFCHRRWRQVQYMADVFWRRLTNDYFPGLQTRTKWLREETNVRADDVVLIFHGTVGNWVVLCLLFRVWTDSYEPSRSKQGIL